MENVPFNFKTDFNFKTEMQGEGRGKKGKGETTLI